MHAGVALAAEDHPPAAPNATNGYVRSDSLLEQGECRDPFKTHNAGNAEYIGETQGETDEGNTMLNRHCQEFWLEPA